ncbi:alkene reductase [Elizabethkingia argentiflava]|uniref:Alkene reductase n=1 Tax=Elizabethkingia argenteiflava TaxID=2681556 RepID=A0A845PV20_9FLAO|nr:alkene reductase [Elizabethkingia argenteiflava]NAW50327.1 alkene reductase [Elizabethkingia argenteiflava]
MNTILSTPIKIGAYTLSNRGVMAPLTRMRADENLVPPELAATYYGQRATSGLIISEATQISQQGQGYPNTPGIYTKEQVEQWKKITQSVHQQGGLMFLQLWHVGRVFHSVYQPQHKLPVAPSAIPAVGRTFQPDFSRTPYEIPHALTPEEIKEVVEDYRKATQNAKEAGFDGVEIHAANGYLIEQFLKTVSNKREDEYGGSIKKRVRIVFEIIDAIKTLWPSDKIGLRISPHYTGAIEEDPKALEVYDYLVQQLDPYKLAYLHVVEIGDFTQASIDVPDLDSLLAKRYKAFYSHPIISAGGYGRVRAELVLEKGYADAVAFGKAYISTPDLAYRLINGLEINPVDSSTYYGGGAKGYID